MLDLEFLEKAESDVRRLYHFLADIDPVAATKAIDAIFENIDLLLKHPEMGRPFEGHTVLRQWTVSFGRNGYAIQYGVEDQTLFVTRIWHTREER